MGNRAVIAFQGKASPPSKCVYLHWNGGRASVEAFLSAAKTLQLKPSETALRDMIYPFFNGTKPGAEAPSVYVQPLNRADVDNGDNGLYVINREFEIVDRRYVNRRGEEIDAEKTADIRATVIALNALL